MNYISWIARILRRYCLTLECFVIFCVVFLTYQWFFNGYSLRSLFERVRVKLELRLAGQYDRLPGQGDQDVTTEKSKASWELRKGNVGVYAIQGRRPHMEDRFNVVNDLEHTGTSIFGIFDGHGGEVRHQLTILTM